MVSIRMNAKVWLPAGALIVLVILVWVLLQLNKEERHEGLSFLPERQADIPMFDGLGRHGGKLTIRGDRRSELYAFYSQQLPALGWKAEHEGWGEAGGISRWRKNGFDGVLWVGIHYDATEERTEVIFDKTPLGLSTPWVTPAPASVCVYSNLEAEHCETIPDRVRIAGLAELVNTAIDWTEEREPRSRSSVIDFGELRVTVHYGDGQMIYLVSDKGMKLLKPEGEFFTYANLPRDAAE